MTAPQFLALVERDGSESPLFAGVYDSESEAWLAGEIIAKDLDTVWICRRLGAGQWASRRGWKSMAWTPSDQRQADLWEWRYRGELSSPEREMIVSDSHSESLRALAHIRRCSEEEALAHALRLALDCEKAFSNGHKPMIERGPGILQPLHGWEHHRPTPPAPAPALSRPRVREWQLDSGYADEVEVARQDPPPATAEEPKGDRGNCRSCGQVIYWRLTSTGKPCPWNADGTSHFANCPHAARHRKGGRR